MSKLSLYRRRFIPDEVTHLKDDIILYMKDNLIITKWKPLRPKTYMSSGLSAYYIDQGFKVSKIYDNDNLFSYWYCDIVQFKPEPVPNSILYEDLLVDVAVLNDGTVKVLDLDELVDTLELKLISVDELKKALRILDNLLKIIYQGRFDELKAPINKAEATYSSII